MARFHGPQGIFEVPDTEASNYEGNPLYVRLGAKAAPPAYFGFGGKVLAAGGGAVLPRTTVSNVQKADGSWLLNKAAVDSAHRAGYAVEWTENSTANKPVVVGDGPQDYDVINGAPVPSGTFPALPAEPVLSYVTITAPTAVEADGTANDFVRLTKTVGAIWTVAGVDHDSAAFTGATKDVPAGGASSVTVTVRAAAGYALSPGHTTSWTLSFSTASAASVLFSDDFGTTALTEAAFLARTTPVGGVAVSKAGAGTVTVNSSGHLVIDATAGATAVDWAEQSVEGRLVADVVSVTGLTGTNNIQLELRGGTAGAYATGRFYAAYYVSGISVGGTETISGSQTRLATPSQWQTSLKESGGVMTVTSRDGGPSGSAATRTYTGTLSGARKGRIFVPAGTILTLSAVKKEAV